MNSGVLHLSLFHFTPFSSVLPLGVRGLVVIGNAVADQASDTATATLMTEEQLFEDGTNSLTFQLWGLYEP